MAQLLWELGNEPVDKSSFPPTLSASPPVFYINVYMKYDSIHALITSEARAVPAVLAEWQAVV